MSKSEDKSTRKKYFSKKKEIENKKRKMKEISKKSVKKSGKQHNLA